MLILIVSAKWNNSWSYGYYSQEIKAVIFSLIRKRKQVGERFSWVEKRFEG